MCLPCPFCSDFPLRPCDRFEFIGLAGHFTGDWAQTPSHSSRQLPMYTNVIFCCTGWLIGTLTMSYYNHLQSAYRHATIYGHDETEQTCYVIHVKSVSEKITCSYASANKNKKAKNKNDLSQPLVEMYSIALPTGRPPIYNRVHNKVAWTTQAKCGFGGTVFDVLATTKFSKPTGLCEIKLTNHWSLEVPIQSEHWSFFLLLKGEWCTPEVRKVSFWNK